jgi:hypothetical protein
MRIPLGPPLLALSVACGGGTLDLDDDTQRSCPAARVDLTTLAYEDALFLGSPGQTLVFRNGCTASSGDLVLELRVDGEAGFGLSTTSLTLAPGATSVVDVRYTPVGYGPAAATLVATTNDPDVPQLTVGLSATTDPDQDDDGFQAAEVGGDDCDDSDAAISPAGVEIWYDGVDQDCDGASDYDQDGDGFDRGPEGGDCNDVDATVNPEAAERDDLSDNDCDGWVDEDFVRPNDVLVTEVMADPVAVFDTSGEWFELQNVSARRVNLRGWLVTDYQGDSFTLSGDLNLDPGQRVVLAVSDDFDRNGGVRAEVVYDRDRFDLDNASDAIGLEVAGNTVTLLEYDVGWAVEAGASLSLDPAFATRDGATLGKNWCAASTRLAGGDAGTPGTANDVCTSVDHDGDGISVDDGDCDDANGAVYPGAPERWNGTDDDCDGTADNAKVAVTRSGYVDGYSGDRLSFWNSLSTGDIDGDGDLELMIGTINRGATRDGIVYTLDAADADTWAGDISAYTEASIEGVGTYNNQALLSPVQRDVDGDGKVDLVIGGTSRLTTGGMAVALYSNGSGIKGTMDTEDADAVWVGGLSIDNIRVASHLDMDGDGVAEIAYGDPGAIVSGFYSAGAAWLIDADGASGEYTLESDFVAKWAAGASTEMIGSTLEGGDLDGDGYDELIVCGRYADFVATNAGGCAILAGSKERPDGGTIDDEATALIGGTSFSDALGNTATLGLGDFDGDGELDLAVPSPAAGRVYVFMSVGALEGTWGIDDADVRIQATTGPTGFGTSVAVGDLDGDGTHDLAVGAPDSLYVEGYGADEVGRIWVWSGDSIGSRSSVRESDAMGWVDGEGVGGSFGWAMLIADLDGDGVDDLVAGEPSHRSGAGRVSILLHE